MASTAQYNNKMLIIETFLKETDKISVLLPFINQSINSFFSKNKLFPSFSSYYWKAHDDVTFLQISSANIIIIYSANTGFLTKDKKKLFQINNLLINSALKTFLLVCIIDLGGEKLHVTESVR